MKNRRNHYRIMGNYGKTCEEIDSADTEKEARSLREEYQMAFGSNWEIWVEVQKHYGDTLDSVEKLE